MLRPRIIPCLLIHDNGLVKTTKFKEPKYVGDSLNAVKIFNEKNVDELIVLDIDASVLNKEPDFELIKNLANECRMPLCYGGGVKTVEQAKKIINLGAEKVALGSAAIDNPLLIKQISDAVGSQSVVVVMDVKKSFFGGQYECFTLNGKKNGGKKPSEFAKEIEKLGAGEIVVNSIDQDGTMLGYDTKLVNLIRDATSLPITALGGAGKLEDFSDLIDKFGVIGCGAGSYFVFKGKYKAVLISYPNKLEKEYLIKTYL